MVRCDACVEQSRYENPLSRERVTYARKLPRRHPSPLGVKPPRVPIDMALCEPDGADVHLVHRLHLLAGPPFCLTVT